MNRHAAFLLTTSIAGLTLCAPLLAAPPARELLAEVDAFRELGGGAGAWQVDGEPLELDALSDLLPSTLRPDEAATAAAVLRCALRCEDDFSDALVEASGAALDEELVSMRFDADDTILATVGQAHAPGQLALTFERDTYRPRAVQLVTEGGHRIDIALVDYTRDGWAPRRVTLRVDGGATTELVREP